MASFPLNNLIWTRTKYKTLLYKMKNVLILGRFSELPFLKASVSNEMRLHTSCWFRGKEKNLMRLLMTKMPILISQITMPGPISQNGNFYSNDASSIYWLQISFKSVKPFGHKKWLRILQLPIPYCVKCYGYHNYTLLTLKYGVNLLSAPVSSVLRQNLRAILTATGSV